MSKTYKDVLSQFSSQLVSEHNYYIIGQGASEGGHGMSSTIDLALKNNLIELPVFEETQTGMALGMALSGLNVISIYPRFDFFIAGMNQLVNHSDKVRVMSKEMFSPNIIFRVGVGAKVPIDAGPQHTNNYTKQFREILTDIKVHELNNNCSPFPIFNEILKNGGLHLIVEHYENYGDPICGS